MNFRINVYGKREALIKNKKINYCGSFRADILPDKLREIWDLSGMAFGGCSPAIRCRSGIIPDTIHHTSFPAIWRLVCL